MNSHQPYTGPVAWYEARLHSETGWDIVGGVFPGSPVVLHGASPTLGTLQRTDTDRILLFKRNLEKIASTRAELVEQIQITVKHEIGHFLGMDEEEVERLGLA